MTPTKPTTSTIKGYIPVRLELPPILLLRNDDDIQRHTFTSFIYVKEHAPKSHSATSSSVNDDGDSATRTLFIANCPANGPIPTDAYLRAIFESSPFDADIVRVTVIQDPRHTSSSATAAATTPNEMFFRQQTTGTDIYYANSSRRKGDGKFAHVVFATAKEMKRVLKKLLVLLNNSKEPLRLENDIIHRLSVETTKENSNNDDKQEELVGIHAVIKRAHYMAGRHMSRQELMQQCNNVMTLYEHDEEVMINKAKLAKDQPDDDGFITVSHNKKKTSSSSSMTMMTTTSSIELEEDYGGGIGRQRRGRNRKRKNNNLISGADELTDFYRYQMKQSRKVEVQDLKKRFEEDLVRVQKMKEERAYRPF
jgi:ribosomal RNA-processing protein 7